MPKVLGRPADKYPGHIAKLESRQRWDRQSEDRPVPKVWLVFEIAVSPRGEGGRSVTSGRLFGARTDSGLDVRVGGRASRPEGLSLAVSSLVPSRTAAAGPRLGPLGIWSICHNVPTSAARLFRCGRRVSNNKKVVVGKK